MRVGRDRSILHVLTRGRPDSSLSSFELGLPRTQSSSRGFDLVVPDSQGRSFLFVCCPVPVVVVSARHTNDAIQQSQFSVEDATATISSGAISERTRKLKEEQEALRQKHATERQDTDLPLISAEMARMVRRIGPAHPRP